VLQGTQPAKGGRACCDRQGTSLMLRRCAQHLVAAGAPRCCDCNRVRAIEKYHARSSTDGERKLGAVIGRAFWSISSTLRPPFAVCSKGGIEGGNWWKPPGSGQLVRVAPRRAAIWHGNCKQCPLAAVSPASGQAFVGSRKTGDGSLV